MILFFLLSIGSTSFDVVKGQPEKMFLTNGTAALENHRVYYPLGETLYSWDLSGKLGELTIFDGPIHNFLELDGENI